jgi:hypothetical protein
MVTPPAPLLERWCGLRSLPPAASLDARHAPPQPIGRSRPSAFGKGASSAIVSVARQPLRWQAGPWFRLRATMATTRAAAPQVSQPKEPYLRGRAPKQARKLGRKLRLDIFYNL